MNRILVKLMLIVLIPATAFSGSVIEVDSPIDVLQDELLERIPTLTADDLLRINVIPGVTGQATGNFTGQFQDSGASVPPIEALTRVEIIRSPAAPRLTLRGDGSARLIRVREGGSLYLRGLDVENFSGQGNGGAILAENEARVDLKDMQFAGNQATGNGGAVAGIGTAHIGVWDSRFTGGYADVYGGALSIEGEATAEVERSSFDNNDAGVFGCDVNVNSNGVFAVQAALVMIGVIALSQCAVSNFENPLGRMFIRASTLTNPTNIIDSVTVVSLYLVALILAILQTSDLEASGGSSTQAACNDFGSGAFDSLGYNMSSDNSCDLDRGTDLPGADPLFEEVENGFLAPADGSPAIDNGPTEAVSFGGGSLAALPCGYKDLLGTARPQDANDDGEFECDRGAIEIPGPGAIVPGHSGSFANLDRDGEGQFVEILNEDTAVVYTFSYRPDGSGPAWFIGVGSVAGNSIIIDDLLRPIGTSFGDGFDAQAIDFTPAGAQNMVFNDCPAQLPGGNTAFTGSEALGYEALITRAGRISHVTGCGAETPHPNAGLSGSYFDPARNGEGVIVQWLPNGQVLVIFFTFDLADNQMWALGVGTAMGNSVTINALYPSTPTRWGLNFNKDEIVLSAWGTFMLTWTDCGGVEFTYDSAVPGYGSATRNYTRLTTYAGTTCPVFQAAAR